MNRRTLITAPKIVTGLSALVVIVMITWAVRIVQDYEHRIDGLEAIAQKYRSICGGVKAQLRADRSLLRNIHDREIMLARFAGSCGDDSAAMLERCLPTPFPTEAWRRCVETHDDTCLDGLLRVAEASIPQ